MLRSYSDLGAFPFLQFVQKSLCRIVIISALNVRYNSPVKVSEPGASFERRFLTTISIPLLDIGLFNYPFLIQ